MGKLTRWIESSAMVDPDLAPTIATDGNLRFTENGVYAEYLLAGPHYPYQTVRRRQGVARVNRDLALALPSGSLLMGPGPGLEQVEQTFATEAEPDAVVAFYREHAEAAGLTSVMGMNQGDARAYGAAGAQPNGASLQVVASPGETDRTSVQLTWNAGR